MARFGAHVSAPRPRRRWSRESELPHIQTDAQRSPLNRDFFNSIGQLGPELNSEIRALRDWDRKFIARQSHVVLGARLFRENGRFARLMK